MHYLEEDLQVFFPQADINNEREPRNATYAENLRRLEKFVMVKFEADTMVDPRVCR